MAGDGYFSSRYFPEGYFGSFFGGSGSGSGTQSGVSAGLATALGLATGIGSLSGSAGGLSSVTGALTSSVSPAALTAFQPNAFQVDAFQIAVEVMATAIAYQETRPAKGAKARRVRREEEEAEDEIAKARREGRLRKIRPADFDAGSDKPIFVSEEAQAEAETKKKRRKALVAKDAAKGAIQPVAVTVPSSIVEKLGALSANDASAALIAALCKVSEMERAAHLRALEAEAAEDDDMEALLLMMEF